MQDYLSSNRLNLLKIIVWVITLSLVLAISSLSADYLVFLPATASQALTKTEKLDDKSHELEKHQTSSYPLEDDFQAGQSCMVNGDFQKARGHFTNYLKFNQVRVDSDLDLANLIGLGLACEALEDYRFAEGYFYLAARVCLQRWYMITSSQCCNFFSGQVYGFSRLEPFEGLMRLAVQENDLSGGFYWSEIIHSLKMIERMTCPDQVAQSDVSKGIGGEKVEIRESFVAVFNQMKSALERNDRNVFLELTSRLDRLCKKYRNFGSELSIQPIKASKIPLKPNETLLEYQVTEHKTFAWVVQNRRIIKNMVIPVSRQDLEMKINNYVGTATNRLPPTKTAHYDPYLGQELYSLLLKELLLSLQEVKKLIIIPDGVLWDLPFETLVNQASGDEANLKARGNQPLRNSLVIEYYQSATALQISRQKKN